MIGRINEKIKKGKIIMDDTYVSFFFFSFFLFFLEQLKFGVARVKINETVLQKTRKSISISLENILLRKTNSYLWQEVGGKFRLYSEITGVCLVVKEKIYHISIISIQHLFWYFLPNKWVTPISKNHIKLF